MMNEDQAKQDKFTGLRRRAEAAAQAQLVDPAELSADDIRNLIHELQVHQIELEMQNDELRQAQQQLEESRDNYVDLYDFAPVGYFTVSEKGLILEANLTGAMMLGADRSRLLKQPFSRFVARDDEDIFYLHHKQVFESRTPQMCELKMVKQDGSPFEARLECIVVLDSQGNYSCFRTAVIDITGRKQAEEQLKIALAEKETLLKEVYHRVKNNLGALSYLIEMQVQTTKTPEVHTALEEIQGRINAMGLVHQKLYQTKDLSQIDFGDYLEYMTANLRYVLAGGRSISLRVEADDIFIEAGIALPCGLIVNELVTNAFKYAFPKDQDLTGFSKPVRSECEIRVEFGLFDGEYVLTVSDNGVGLPPKLDWRTTESLGLKLVNLWATHQLGGCLEMDDRAGAVFTIRFSKRK